MNTEQANNSSEPIEEKPFLTFEDAEENASDLYSSWNEKDEYNACINGYKAASKKANTHISSLESELKALREERDALLLNFIKWSYKSDHEYAMRILKQFKAKI